MSVTFQDLKDVDKVKTRRSHAILVGLGALIGILIFVLIYGVKILDPTYIGFIYNGDNDLKQHYIGWSQYRQCAWRFPIGLVDSLSYPTAISVIYTDSIPLVACIFKLFSPILPVDFQYFGLVGILSFALMGATSAILLNRFIKSIPTCILLTPFFVASFPILQRMYYHTALAAHWLIIIALILWVYDTACEKANRYIVYWGLLGFFAVSIHTYYIPILGMVLLADCVTVFIFNKKSLFRAVMQIVTFCAAGLLSLWIFGGFYGNGSAVGFGLGTFGANFNTFINPIDYGVILPNMGIQNYFQYEGCGYLGFGILILSVLADVLFIVNKKKLEITKEQKTYLFVGLGLLLCSFGFATLPMISIGEWTIGQIPYPEPIFKVLSIFRSNGRFIWVGMYLLMLITVVAIERMLASKPVILYGVIAAGLILQFVDLSGMIAERQKFYRENHDVSICWDTDINLAKMAAGKKSFIFMYDVNDLNMETAFYAYRNGMTLNSFYFARDINEDVKNQINKYWDEIAGSNIRGDAVYLMKNEDFEANRDFIEGLPVYIYEYDGHRVITAK